MTAPASALCEHEWSPHDERGRDLDGGYRGYRCTKCGVVKHFAVVVARQRDRIGDLRAEVATLRAAQETWTAAHCAALAEDEREMSRLRGELADAERALAAAGYGASDPSAGDPLPFAERLKMALDLLEGLHTDLNEMTAMRDELAEKSGRFARWIKIHGDRFTGDHACAECFPTETMLVEGFQCAYHEAATFVTESPK